MPSPAAADTPLACPLCLGGRVRFLHRSDDRHGVREFYVCADCDLAFVPPRFHLPPDAERERYLLHNNDTADAGYRAFLGRLWDVLKPRLAAGASGLDFGCGPGPALAMMMEEDGFAVEKYDPHFFPNRAALGRAYDFIVCTETFEHLRSPREALREMDGALKPGGFLGAMTGMLDDRSAFASWHYQRDPTHVAFYSRETMRRIAALMGWNVDFPTRNVAIFAKRRKPPHGDGRGRVDYQP